MEEQIYPCTICEHGLVVEGEAYPCSSCSKIQDEGDNHFQPLGLRDKIAMTEGCAMVEQFEKWAIDSSLEASSNWHVMTDEKRMLAIAKVRYQYADAMLRARQMGAEELRDRNSR